MVGLSAGLHRQLLQGFLGNLDEKTPLTFGGDPDKETVPGIFLSLSVTLKDRA